MASVLPELDAYRVIAVGERHDRYDHHLNQLAVIKSLYKDNPSLVIGMEFFQQPFQQHLDAFIAGDIDEQTMLRQTEYFTRWGYDYRLYAPILRFARQHSIPLLALNVPKEITRQTARGGISSLSDAQRAQIPQELNRDNQAYNARIKGVFSMHGDVGHGMNIDNFLEAQLLWDEGMAERAANYLKQHPTHKMVVLAGAGHIMYRDGIPERLERRINTPVATLLNAAPNDLLDQSMADFFIETDELHLPVKGMLGISMAQYQDGVYVHALGHNSAAGDAGMTAGDRITQLQGQPINTVADIGLLMWQSKPGDEITIAALRGQDKPEVMNFRVVLR